MRLFLLVSLSLTISGSEKRPVGEHWTLDCSLVLVANADDLFLEVRFMQPSLALVRWVPSKPQECCVGDRAGLKWHQGLHDV